MKYEAMGGETISTACVEMFKLAIVSHENVESEFNGIPLIAEPGMPPEVIEAQYWTELNRRNAEYAASPEGIAAKARREEVDREADEAKAEGILPFSVADQQAWDKCREANMDGDYGEAVLRYLARWANLMEPRMAAGESLADIAHQASHDAAKEGITGFQYGCAVSCLSQVWKHGAELRRWHDERENALTGKGK